ncbi:MAG TPA: SAF domain-containing protein [Bacilli bacterium]
MNRRRQFWVSIMAAVTAALMMYGIYALQLQQIELQKTIRVVVPKHFIPPGTLLTADMLEYTDVFLAGYREDMASDKASVAGMEAIVPLGAHEPILTWKLDSLHLYPGKGEATFQIPKEYILSVSNGIRAGDLVEIFVSPAAGPPAKLFARKIVVASVKTSANVEIDNAEQPNLLAKARNDTESMYISRRNANGAIEWVNLNLTPEEWLMIDETCKDKSGRLVIAFASFSGAKPPIAANRQTGEGES